MSEVPVTREPCLVVEIDSFPLDEVVRWIETSGKSGRMDFDSEECAKQVYLHRGEVVFANSDQSVDRLGECLLRAGVIQLDQLREAERCYERPARFGRVLVERGFLTPRELWNGVKYQVEEIVRSLFTYERGRVRFFEGEDQPDNVVRLSLSTTRLASEGLMRRKELEKFLELLSQPDVELSPRSDVVARLSEDERRITEALATGTHFDELKGALGWSTHSLLRNLQLLRLVGAVELTRQQSPASFVGASDLEAYRREELEFLVSSELKLIGELASRIVELDGEEAVRGRLELSLDEASRHFPELLGGVALDSSLSLDTEEVLGRALRLDDEPEEQVCAALGEIVSYLEFEVKNHPGIPEPDRLLAELRASHRTP